MAQKINFSNFIGGNVVIGYHSGQKIRRASIQTVSQSKGKVSITFNSLYEFLYTKGGYKKLELKKNQKITLSLKSEIESVTTKSGGKGLKFAGNGKDTTLFYPPKK